MDAAAASGLARAGVAAQAQAAQQRQQQATANAAAATAGGSSGAAAAAGGAGAAAAAVPPPPPSSSSSLPPHRQRGGRGFQSKRSRPWPLLTPEQLADDTPSRRAGIPAKRERAFYRNLYSLVREGGQALCLAQQTTTTALLFGFRYFALRSFSRSDRFVVGAAALFLAAKARDELRPLDAVVVACLKVREAQGGGGKKKGGGSASAAAAAQEGAGSVAASPMHTPTPTLAGHGGGSGAGAGSSAALPSPASRTAAAIAAASLSGGGSGPSTLAAQLADKAYMGSLKEAVLTAERALLYALGFELDLELPHDALMASLALLRKSGDPAVAAFWADPKHTQVALSFINDSFRTSLCLMHDWAHVGVGALVAVVDKLGGPPPVVDGGGGSGGVGSAPRFFWELVPSCGDLTPELLADVVRIISGMYETAAAPAPAAAATAAAPAGGGGKKRRASGEGGEGRDGGGEGAADGGNKRARTTEEGAAAAAGPSSAAATATAVLDAAAANADVKQEQQQGQFRRRKRGQKPKRKMALLSLLSSLKH